MQGWKMEGWKKETGKAGQKSEGALAVRLLRPLKLSRKDFGFSVPFVESASAVRLPLLL
jgi:hypothetical protein